MPASELPLDHPNIEDRLLWSFVSRTYIRWFDGGAEEFPEQEQELEEVFDRLAASTFEEAETLETEIAKRKAELKQLESQEVSSGTISLTAATDQTARARIHRLDGGQDKVQKLHRANDDAMRQDA
jgi:kinetochore protein NDC80